MACATDINITTGSDGLTTSNTGSAVRLGQSWTAGLNGTLCEVSVTFAGSVNPNPINETFLVEVYLGIPTTSSSPIGSKSFVLSGLDTTNDVVQTFDMLSANISITSGTVYTAIIYPSSSTVYTLLGSENSSIYPDGDRVEVELSGGTPNQVNTFSSSDVNVTIGVQEEVSGFGDPVIAPIAGDNYTLPVDEEIYCLFDNRDFFNRFVINFKCYIRSNGASYIKYVYLNFKGEELIVDVTNMNLKDKGSDFNNDVANLSLPDSDNQSYSSSVIQEVLNQPRYREWKITTDFFGDLYFFCRKIGHKTGLKGDISQFVNDSSTGCVFGSDEMHTVSSLDYLAPVNLPCNVV